MVVVIGGKGLVGIEAWYVYFGFRLGVVDEVL